MRLGSPATWVVETPRCCKSFWVEAMSSRSGTLARSSGSAISRLAHMIGSAAFLAPLISTVPSSGTPPLMRMRSMGGRKSFSLELGQGDAGLSHILALAVGIGDFGLLGALQEQELADAFVGVDPRRQRRRVADLQRHVALPFRLEWRDVHEHAAPRVGALA